ncbi:MAG: DUF4230 domain-containing protein [Bacteroidota bacterium]
MRKLLFITLLFILPNACNVEEEDPKISVVQLQTMADMATVEFVVSKIVKVSNDKTWYTYGDRKILMSVTATIKAGVSMESLTEENLKIEGNSVMLQLPGAKMISLNVDPESIKEEYAYTGFFRDSFSNEERYALLAQAEKEIENQIGQMEVIRTAETHAILFFESWLRLMGFENPIVVIQK